MNATSRRRRWWSRATVVLQLACVATIGWFVLPERFGGETTYVVVKGTSMRPHYVTGDIVAARPADRYEVGDVVVYAIPDGEVGAGKLVMHRIIGTDSEGRFVFRGDNKAEPDEFRLTADDIVGVERLHVPHVALVAQVVLRWWVLAGVTGVITLFALWPKRRPTEEPEETERTGSTDAGAIDAAVLVPAGSDDAGSEQVVPEPVEPEPVVPEEVPARRVSVVVDGDSVVAAGTVMADGDALDARQACVDEADRLVRRYGGNALVVVGAGLGRPVARGDAAVHVGELGAVVAALVAHESDFVGARTLLVVTDDEARAAASRRCGAAVVSSAAWWGLVAA